MTEKSHRHSNRQIGPTLSSNLSKKLVLRKLQEVTASSPSFYTCGHKLKLHEKSMKDVVYIDLTI